MEINLLSWIAVWFFYQLTWSKLAAEGVISKLVTTYGFNWESDHKDLQTHLVTHFLQDVALIPEPFGICVRYENDNMYCPLCEARYPGPCKIHGPSTIVYDTVVLPNTDLRCFKTLPYGLSVAPSSIPEAGLGIWTINPIAKSTRFGPYEGLVKYNAEDTDHLRTWVVHTGSTKFFVDSNDENFGNWLGHVNTANCSQYKNIKAVSYKGTIFYYTTNDIPAGSELLVFYGWGYVVNNLNVNLTACIEEAQQQGLEIL